MFREVILMSSRYTWQDLSPHSLMALLLSCISLPVMATPDIQTWQSEAGARVMFVQADEIPMLDVRVVFDAGSARDEGKYGLAVLTNGLLSEGAAGKDAQQIAEDFESVGAQIEYDALRDMAVVGVRTLTEQPYMQSALSSLAEVLTQPDFPQDAFDRERSRMLLSVKARKQSPAAIAGEAFNLAVFGDHPYAFPNAGTEQSLTGLSRDDVVAFYRRYYVAANATIAIVGDIDRARAETIVERLMSGLAKGNAAPLLPEVEPLKQAQTVRIEFPSQQTHIYVGQPGIKRGDDDYLDLYVANHIFGGSGFASRLVEVIREDRGLAYSVYSYFSPMRQLGAFTMGMQTKNDQAGEALKLLDEQLREYVAKGPTADELDKSVSNITGGFPLKFDSNGKLLEYIAMIGFYNLDIHYLDHFIDDVRAVTLDSIRDALERRLHPDRMVTVIVGDGVNGVDKQD
jgi:zinc protease